MAIANCSLPLDQNHVKEEDITNIIIDLIWKTIDGTIKFEQLLSYMKEVKDTNVNSRLESLLADVLSIIDIELASMSFSPRSIKTKSAASSDDLSEANLLSVKKERFYSLIISMRSFIGEDILRERLEIETLEAVKLIAKKEVFNQKYIKTKTRLFYKQQKFNLLREESEGYSKLITELSSSNATDANRILENIQSLIGCFNLDPNRVLDIILECFEMKNSVVEIKIIIDLLSIYKSDNETICQIIGFKLQSLHHQQVLSLKTLNNEFDYDLSNLENLIIKMESLYLVASYLLNNKTIDLDLLLVHLFPNEEQINQSLKDEFESAKQYSKKLTMVNLAESNPKENKDGGKTDHENDSNLVKIETIKLTSENQRIGLLNSLIQIGAFETALQLIEKFPTWYLASVCSADLVASMCKSIDCQLVEPLYKIYNNCFMKSSLVDEVVNEDQLLETFVKYTLPILMALGVGISNNTILFTKLIRICVSYMEKNKIPSASPSFTSSEGAINQDKENIELSPGPNSPISFSRSQSPPLQDQNHFIQQTSVELAVESVLATLSDVKVLFYNKMLSLISDVFLPSLSLVPMNPCIAIELWNLLKKFPYEMRYYLYNNWRQCSYRQFPQLIRAKAECQEKIKYLLKRLTKENVKIHGRQIGKLSHNNPIIVCDYILTQIQRYDNFILPIVDSLKFMTALSYDVLSYCTIVAISDAEKEKMKYDSTSISSWLQSIANFSALAFKKYPIELTAIIQYVINQLKSKKSYDLLILQELVHKMCGIEVMSEVNALQLEAMSGGDLLRQEAGYFNQIRNIKKSSVRLKEALADHGLILPLCILLSQQRDFIVYSINPNSTEKRHLKLTGCLYDQCQDSLVQFSQFLSSTLTTEEYIHIFPKIDELVTVYHMSLDVAFFLSRPMYIHHIQSKYEELRKLDRQARSTDKPSKVQRYLEAIDSVMQPIVNLARILQPPKTWEEMSPLFYTSFWALTMSDLFVPTQAYEKQRISLKQKLMALDDNPDLTSVKKKKEKEKLQMIIDKLTEEENKQKEHVQHVKARLEKEKDEWFPLKNKAKNETITLFLQLCVFSRCLFTQIDAYYCAKFIQYIHSLKTPNFSTIICYDRIFSDISYSIASLTDSEASRYGRFILGLLETVMSWHADPNTFEAECANFPGFLTVFRNALNTATSNSSVATKQEQLDYENFRHVCHKWHYKLTKSFIVCLESKEYLQMRNALVILTKILPHYPKLTTFYSALDKRVADIIEAEKNKRPDIFTLASVYLGQLRHKKATMVEEAKFHLKETTVLKASAASVDAKPVINDSSNEKFKQPSTTSTTIKQSNTTSNTMQLQSLVISQATASNNLVSVTGTATSKLSAKSASFSSLNGATKENTTATVPESPPHSSSRVILRNRSPGPSTEKPTNGSKIQQISQSTATQQNINGSAMASVPTNIDEFSPTRSVSSDDLSVNSPKQRTSVNQQQNTNKERESTRSAASRNASPSRSSNINQKTKDGSGEKAKRQKTDSNIEELASSVSDNAINVSSSTSFSNTNGASKSSTQDSSTKRRGGGGDKDYERTSTDQQLRNRNISASSTSTSSHYDHNKDRDKDKKDHHRKREHSSSGGGDLSNDVQQKRPKSDETKKKSSASSANVAPKLTSPLVQPVSNFSSSSSPSGSKRSSKKLETSGHKDDVSPTRANPSHAISHSITHSSRSISKHHSDHERRSHDKRNAALQT